MNELYKALTYLLDSSEPLTQSAFTANQRKALEHFAQSTRLIEIRKQGRTVQYRILNRHSLALYLKQQQPLTSEAIPSGLPTRSRNIAMFRDSKKGHTGHACCYLLLKAWDEGAIWWEENYTLSAAAATEKYGIAALQIFADSSWSSNRPLLLVENQALFDCCDWLPAGFNGSLAYYSGQLADVLLQWLAANKRTGSVTLFPDYDGIGLSNYVRLAESLHPDSQLLFYWLPDWEAKLERYGNADVWRKTRPLFENAYAKLNAGHALDDNFKKLATLSQQHGRALEQEAIWLPLT